jgi:hypothetical protein
MKSQVFATACGLIINSTALGSLPRERQSFQQASFCHELTIEYSKTLSELSGKIEVGHRIDVFAVSEANGVIEISEIAKAIVVRAIDSAKGTVTLLVTDRDSARLQRANKESLLFLKPHK